MRIDGPTSLLGGLSPQRFMERHWQKKPLVVRAAWPGAMSGFDRRCLFALAGEDGVESRLAINDGGRWSLQAGPFARRSLPALGVSGWTVLVQGVDLHVPSARALLDAFRFIADARLDDVMVSYASNGGGVGPHVDSYDVFLLQLAGVRHWRVGRCRKPSLRDDVPLRMLADFAPTHDWRLEAGDMLYLPPGWGHEGVAVGECLTASIGFRAPSMRELGTDLLQRVAEHADAAANTADSDARRDASPHRDRRYADAGSGATRHPARIPPALQRYADRAVVRLLRDAEARRRALGESLSEPKPQTWFEHGAPIPIDAGLDLDRRTRMLYDDRFVFINGVSFVPCAAERSLLRRLADRRFLEAETIGAASPRTRERLEEWAAAGWCAGRSPILHP